MLKLIICTGPIFQLKKIKHNELGVGSWTIWPRLFIILSVFLPSIHYSFLSSCWLFIIHNRFSKSLIIHEEKTKEITTVKEVWICDPNYHKIQWAFALRSYYKHSKECFIRYPNTSKLVKRTRLRLIFSTHLSVFGYLMKHSSLCLIYYLRVLFYLLFHRHGCVIIIPDFPSLNIHYSMIFI